MISRIYILINHVEKTQSVILKTKGPETTMPTFVYILFLTDRTIYMETSLIQFEGAFYLADDLPNLRLLGERGRGQRNGLRGRAHPSQQGPHRPHG